MKKILVATLAAGAALLTAACADDGYYRHGPMAVSYDGYYDDAYGPFYDGYWGGDGFFYYSSGPGGHFRRDTGHHFRHDNFNGFHSVQGHPQGGGDRGRHR